MSGPYCETCDHFYTPPLTPKDQGLCTDPTKVIYSQAGNAVHSEPEVWSRYTCANWKSRASDSDKHPTNEE